MWGGGQLSPYCPPPSVATPLLTPGIVSALLLVVLRWQMKTAEDDKNKIKQELDDTNKQLTDKTGAEEKAKADVTQLTSEKVGLIAIFLLPFLSRHFRQQLYAMVMSICLCVRLSISRHNAYKNAFYAKTKQLRAIVSIGE